MACMAVKDYFQNALSNFTHEVASGGAIRHLAEPGYTVKQITEKPAKAAGGVNMEIRHTTMDDIPEILAMYQHARKIMAENGNPNQWNPLYPGREDVLEDIAAGNSYICEENGEAVGTFAFIVGEDPTYSYIEDGAWCRNDTYGTIHRLASNGKAKGVAAACFEFCRKKLPHLRADTHEDNRIMQHVLEHFGFRRCGIIYVRNQCPRIAYEYVE